MAMVGMGRERSSETTEQRRSYEDHARVVVLCRVPDIRKLEK